MDEQDEEKYKQPAFKKVEKVINDITVAVGPNSLEKVEMSKKQSSPRVAQNESKTSVLAERGIPSRQFQKLLDLEQQSKIERALNEIINRFKQFGVDLEEQQQKSWLKTQVETNLQKFSNEFPLILTLLKNCSDRTELMTSKELDISLLKTLPAEFEGVLEKCKGDNISDLTDQDVQKTVEVVMKIIDFKQKFKAAIEYIDNKKKEAEIESKKQIEEAKPAVGISSEQMPILTLSCRYLRYCNNEKIPYKCVATNDLQTYIDLMNFHEEYKKSFTQVINDSSLKNFKFQCTKAIRIPVNSLSAITSEHIIDKYSKLHGLLTGQPVTISEGNKDINATRHPQGIPFCMDLLAKAFVQQGDVLVSSKPDTVFCYSSVMLSLWNDFPDFGKLLLAHFYETCPYLVPLYFPQEAGESDEEFYRNLGYQYSDGDVEKHDKYLRRMRGIMKLYFALMIAKPKRGQNRSPYNLKHGWKWLASLLKLEPQVDITATALHAFLETVGFQMEATYGKMFEKLLIIIIQVFLPKCKDKYTGGAVARLESLLTDYLQNNKLKKPNCYSEYADW